MLCIYKRSQRARKCKRAHSSVGQRDLCEVVQSQIFSSKNELVFNQTEMMMKVVFNFLNFTPNIQRKLLNQTKIFKDNRKYYIKRLTNQKLIGNIEPFNFFVVYFLCSQNLGFTYEIRSRGKHKTKEKAEASRVK